MMGIGSKAVFLKAIGPVLVLLLCSELRAQTIDSSFWTEAGFDVPVDVRSAPNFRLESLNGSKVELLSIKSRVIIVHFWATFCIPCRAEMKELSKFQGQFSRRELLVIAISIDNHDGAVSQFLQREVIQNLLVVRNRSQELRSSYAVNAIPVSYIIVDRQIRARIKGTGNWNPHNWKEILAELNP